MGMLGYWGSGLVGATFGVTTKYMVNSIVGLPARRHPYSYLLRAGFFGYWFAQVPRWEKEIGQRINYKRASIGLPPIKDPDNFGLARILKTDY